MQIQTAERIRSQRLKVPTCTRACLRMFWRSRLMPPTQMSGAVEMREGSVSNADRVSGGRHLSRYPHPRMTVMLSRMRA